MKLIYVLIAVVVVAGAWWYLTKDTSSPVLPGNALPTIGDHDDSDVEHVEGETDDVHHDEAENEPGDTEEPMGTDVGMEFPDADVEPAAAPSEVTFGISGENFKFSMNEIRVKVGDTVTIEFRSTDGFHDWVVDEFAAAADRVQTGESSSVTFVADKEGTFEYYCSVGEHRARGMVGTLIVEG